MYGDFYELSKRICGVTYVLGHDNPNPGASYKILGYLLGTKLLISGLMSLQSKLGGASFWSSQPSQLKAVKDTSITAEVVPWNTTTTFY